MLLMLLHPMREMQTPIASNVWMASLLGILTAGQITRWNSWTQRSIVHVLNNICEQNFQENPHNVARKTPFFYKCP